MNYAPTTLGVQSWRENISVVRERKGLNITELKHTSIGMAALLHSLTRYCWLVRGQHVGKQELLYQPPELLCSFYSPHIICCYRQRETSATGRSHVQGSPTDCVCVCVCVYVCVIACDLENLDNEAA